MTLAATRPPVTRLAQASDAPPRPGPLRFEADGLRKTFTEAHRRYTGRINARFKWTGCLGQGRFSSTPMNGRHTIAAIRHVAMNPVRAKLVERAADWPWSSARAHLAGADDDVVEVRPVLDLVGDFATFLDEPEDAAAIAALRRSRTTGRPAGDEDFMAALEDRLGRILAPAKRGPKPQDTGAAAPADLFRKCHRNPGELASTMRPKNSLNNI